MERDEHRDQQRKGGDQPQLLLPDLDQQSRYDATAQLKYGQRREDRNHFAGDRPVAAENKNEDRRPPQPQHDAGGRRQHERAADQQERHSDHAVGDRFAVTSDAHLIDIRKAAADQCQRGGQQTLRECHVAGKLNAVKAVESTTGSQNKVTSNIEDGI